jgi:hypothetical protein
MGLRAWRIAGVKEAGKMSSWEGGDKKNSEGGRNDKAQGVENRRLGSWKAFKTWPLPHTFYL